MQSNNGLFTLKTQAIAHSWVSIDHIIFIIYSWSIHNGRELPGWFRKIWRRAPEGWTNQTSLSFLWLCFHLCSLEGRYDHSEDPSSARFVLVGFSSFSASSFNTGSFKISPFTQDPRDSREEYSCKMVFHRFFLFQISRLNVIFMWTEVIKMKILRVIQRDEFQ